VAKSYKEQASNCYHHDHKIQKKGCVEMRKSIVLTAAIAAVLFLTCLLLVQPADARAASTQFTVTYDPNGGVGKANAERVSANVDYTIKNQDYSRNGYVFMFWNTKPDGSGYAYSNGQVVSIKESITLYAQWGRVM
jgi:hypothetical protein